jgi:hypothetical protein
MREARRHNVYFRTAHQANRVKTPTQKSSLASDDVLAGGLAVFAASALLDGLGCIRARDGFSVFGTASVSAIDNGQSTQRLSIASARPPRLRNAQAFA